MRYLFSVVLSGLVLSLAACQPPSSPEVTAPTATPDPVLTTETEVVWDVPGQDDYPPAPPADPITDETVAAIIDEINQQSASPELTETPETVASLTEPPESPEPPKPVEPAEPEAPAAPPPPPEVEPATLIGESFTVLIQRFGAPEYIRRDGAIEIYQYRLPTCVIDFVSMPSATIAPGIITSTHGRHRKRGGVYDAKQCAIDLGAHNHALITADS
jgi:hypothetical protein